MRDGSKRKRIEVTRPYLPPIEEFMDMIGGIWENRWLSNFGPLHQRLQDALATYLGVPYVSLFINGHYALEVALQSLDLPQGGEVITTPFTFISTTQAILRSGLKPVFVDIDPLTFTLDPFEVEKHVTDETVAILPVHVYGQIADDKALAAIAQKHSLKIVYDAAHAFGEKIDGRKVGTLGDITMFSFHATKVFNSIEGGCLTYHDPQLADRIQSMCNFGLTNGLEASFVSGNGKMNEFQAAMGLCILPHVDDCIQRRKKVAQSYSSKLADLERSGGRQGPFLRSPVFPDRISFNYGYYPIRLCDGVSVRDGLYDHLQAADIVTRKYFYPLISNMPLMKGRIPEEEFPIAKEVSDSILCLPISPDLEEEEQDRIVREIERFASR